MAAPTIAAFGSEEQRREFLRPLFTGEHIYCQLFSEPGAGSDLAGVATRAVRDGDDWIVNGQKVWTSSAQNAQRAILVARTDPTVPKHQGLTYFVLDMTDPGVDVRPLRQITGEAEFNEVFLTDVRVPDANRLGAEGGGWKVATTTLNNERVAIGSMAGGARESGIIGKVTEAWRTQPALRNAAMHDELMRLWVEAEVARLTGLRLRQRMAVGQPGPEGAGMKVDVCPPGASGFGIRDRTASRRGLAVRRLDDAATGRGRFHRTRPRISLPASQRQLDRGRHIGDTAQHHRRAHSRSAARAPGRQGRGFQGPGQVSTMSDLLYSDTEEALRDSVRRLFADRCPPEAINSLYDAAPQDFSGVWRTLAAELGMAGLLIPEELGGAGATAREAAVVMEEIGRAVAPVPYLSSAVVATVALLQAGDTDTVRGLAAGSLTAALAVPLSTAPGDAINGVKADGNGLTGRITSVIGVRGGRRAAGTGRRTRRAGAAHRRPRRSGGERVTGSEPGHDETPCDRGLLRCGLVARRFRAGRRRGGSGSGDRGGAARIRTTGHRAVVFRDHAGVCQAAQAIRPGDRLVPGHQASARGFVDRAQLRCGGGPIRR